MRDELKRAMEAAAARAARKRLADKRVTTGERSRPAIVGLVLGTPIGVPVNKEPRGSS